VAKSKPFPTRKPVDPYTSKIVKPPSKQQRDTALRHAVTHKDADAIEDYDEWDWKD
jgi:hypothetical protein